VGFVITAETEDWPGLPRGLATIDAIERLIPRVTLCCLCFLLCKTRSAHRAIRAASGVSDR